jgi:hypothetical protein
MIFVTYLHNKCWQTLQNIDALNSGPYLYTTLLSILICILLAGILFNIFLILGLDRKNSKCWILPWLIFQMSSVAILSFAPIFVIFVSYDLQWNFKAERWKIFLALIPTSMAAVGFYFWIQVKIFYDKTTLFIAQPPPIARSAHLSARRKRNTLSAAPVSPVTTYARDVFTNSNNSCLSSGAAVEQQQFFSVPYNDYGPVIPAPDSSHLQPPCTYSFPEFRVTPPTPRPTKDLEEKDKNVSSPD